MIPHLREKFNREFTKEKYEAFLADLHAQHPGKLDFRVSETPVFVPREFTFKMIEACESIVDVILDDSFTKMSEPAIQPGLRVPHESGPPEFIAFDFGVCIDSKGGYEPQLIEMQAFPTLFCWEVMLDDTFRRHFDVPAGFSAYLGNMDRASYLGMLREILVSGEKLEEVILLEIFPEQQKTRIDFYCTKEMIGISVVCLTELIVEGNQVFYMNGDQKTRVRRIYNRVIFDDLAHQTPEVREKGKVLFTELDVTWIPHPNWFYRVSKFTLPFIRSPYVPETFFLDQVKELPGNLADYVLKPLFSFAGQGVVIDLTQDDINKIPDPANWILQRKVQYANVIQTPDEPAKAEIRLFYFWKPGEPRPRPVNNLARLSKGKMIGVRYNRDKEWVGGSFCYFEK